MRNKYMKNFSFVALMVTAMTPLANASESITGKWLIKDNGETATVQIRQSGSGYTGTIVQGKKYVGKTIITGLKDAGDGKYTQGTITDPTNGKHYNLNAEVEGNVLNLRGYIGTPMLGSTQTWYRQ